MMLTVLVNSCQFYFLHLFSLEDKKQSTPTFAFIFPPVLYFFFIFRYTTIDNAFGGIKYIFSFQPLVNGVGKESLQSRDISNSDNASAGSNFLSL